MPRKKAGAAGKRSEFVTAFDRAAAVFTAIAKAVKAEGGSDADLLALIGDPEGLTEIGRTIAHLNALNRTDLMPYDKVLRNMNDANLIRVASAKLQAAGLGSLCSDLLTDPGDRDKSPHPNFPGLPRLAMGHVLTTAELARVLFGHMDIRTESCFDGDQRTLPVGFGHAGLEHAFVYANAHPGFKFPWRVNLWGSVFELKCPNDDKPLSFYFYLSSLGKDGPWVGIDTIVPGWSMEKAYLNSIAAFLIVRFGQEE